MHFDLVAENIIKENVVMCPAIYNKMGPKWVLLMYRSPSIKCSEMGLFVVGQL